MACRADNTGHAGYSGRRADEFSSTFLDQLMDDHTPDQVLLHLGTNDILQGQSVQSTVDDLDRVITDLLDQRPNVTVLLANVIPLDSTGTAQSQTRSLGNALGALALRRAREGDAVRLVDVQSGFDLRIHTDDGVHPNQSGEQLMASRFHQVLDAIDFCNGASGTLPSLQLPRDQWAQIALPADPGVNDTVADIVDELPASDYGSRWVVYEADAGTAGGVRYVQLALDSRMAPGIGYWILQRVAERVIIRMPSGSQKVALTPTPACASSGGCASVPLATRATRYRWNLVGYPLAEARAFSDSRFVTDTGTCVAGCTPDDAQSNGAVHGVLWHYDATVNAYRDISGIDTLQAWQGVWMAVLPDAHQRSPRWLLAAR